jgi:plasmid stabilization system protein ParE
MTIRYTPRARSDLGSIFDFLTAKNPPAAQAVKAEIVFTIGLLADFPQLGVDRPHLEVRALGVARYSYTVYYRVEGVDVWIVHIRDDRRQPSRPGGL